MTRLWVVNASPIISLAKAGYLDLLMNLCPNPLVPAAVAVEIQQGPASDPAHQWITGVGSAFVQPPVEPDMRVLSWDLGAGETEVISLAGARPGSEVILDDLSARNCARALGIPVRGTLGLVLLAKREGVIAAVKPALDGLVRAGLHVDPVLIHHILDRAQENQHS